jgi:hypothetical protein
MHSKAPNPGPESADLSWLHYIQRRMGSLRGPAHGGSSRRILARVSELAQEGEVSCPGVHAKGQYPTDGGVQAASRQRSRT